MFTYAKVNKPIIGADFLRAFGLLVDIRNGCLIEPHTDSQAAGALARGSTLKVSVLAVGAVNDDIHRLIKGFNIMSSQNLLIRPIQHNITHQIITGTSRPVAHRPRRLSPDKLKAAKAEFDFLIA